MEKSSATSFYSLLDWFSDMEDPRLDRKKQYPLDEILFLTVCGVMSGFQGWEEISDFGEEKLEWLRQYRPYENGIPSHDTLNRVMGLIESASFEAFFSVWASGFAPSLAGRLVNLDGKRLRGSANKKEQQTARKEGGKSAVHVVEAWCSDLNLCLGQVKTEEKSNEITAIPSLLEMIELGGSIVSIDAMGCQKSIAEKIVGQNADYLFGLKQNQGALHQKALEAFENESVEGSSVENNSGHGRIEKRICTILPAKVLEKADEWPGLKTVIEIRSERTVLSTGAQSVETRYYLTSLDWPAEKLNSLVRQHWGIENKLHWVMDVFFSEDLDRKRKGNAAQNIALVRRLVLNLLRSHPENISVNRKLAKCAFSDEYRRKVLDF